MVKSCWNVNFEEMDTDCQQEKIMDFQYCEEYLRSIFNKILLCQKSKFSFSCHLEIDKKKINNEKEDPRRKSISNFGFSQAAQRL